MGFSSNNNITGNNISSNLEIGIYLRQSFSNNITNNEILSNNLEGIYLRLSSDDNTIKYNNISFNYNGTTIKESSFNDIVSNNISNNSGSGIRLISSSNSNIITDNNISSNKEMGINISSSSNNKIYHNNIIDNLNQAYDDTNNGNYWDNGYPSGGNYWSDFDEESEGAYDEYYGSNQDILGIDGIVDLGPPVGGKNPYDIDSDSQDNYPLISPVSNYLPLYEGWNLISIPFIQSDTNLGSVLSSIEGDYFAVQWFNATDSDDYWKHNCTIKPEDWNDLDEINHTMGFWIYIRKPGGTLFEYSGIKPSQNQKITLHPGWNLVG
ncbi:MAG: right-handed parallel beta-helix repeat-containing protein, partial [Thermoplasmata archaeon]